MQVWHAMCLGLCKSCWGSLMPTNAEDLQQGPKDDQKHGAAALSNEGRSSSSTGSSSRMAADGWRRTPLQEAAELGDVAKLREVLASVTGSSVASVASAPDELGWTPLHWAALHGAEDIASELLQAQAAVDAEEHEFGCQPLQWAARRGHLRLIRLLIDAGASAEYSDRDGRTAAMWANLTGHALVAAFLEGEAEPEVDESELHIYSRTAAGLDAEAAVEADEAYGMTALHVAAASGHDTKIAHLLRVSGAGLSAQMSAQDAWGRTPFLAAIQAGKPGATAAFGLLPLEPSRASDHDGRGPLQWAVLAGETQLFKELRLNESRADPDPDRWGRTLLHYAAGNGHSDILSELLKNHADPDLKDRAQQTPLHLASARGHVSSVEQLLNHNASPNATDLLLRGPLHYAAMFGHVEVMRLLMTAGADYSAEDLDGEEPGKYLSRTPFLHG